MIRCAACLRLPADGCSWMGAPTCWEHHLAQAPSVTIDEALRSQSGRAQRDRELAAWCGMADDEVGPFLRRLAEFDARTPVWAAKQAAREAELVRLDADLSEFWAQHPFPTPAPLPTRIVTRLGSRLMERL